MIVYIIQKIRGNKNSPNSLNITVNYHYHEKKDNYPVITIYARKFNDVKMHVLKIQWRRSHPSVSPHNILEGLMHLSKNRTP